MIILGASSLFHPVQALAKKPKHRLRGKVIAIPGLSVNRNALKAKTAQFFLARYKETNFVIWHDVVNNSLSEHISNGHITLR